MYLSKFHTKFLSVVRLRPRLADRHRRILLWWAPPVTLLLGRKVLQLVLPR